jgi:sigma-B regulation protein RsbU (phosphoserine phosphatase)
MYTDGLIESTDKKIVWSEGADRMMAACLAVKDVPVDQAPDHIVRALCPDRSRLEDDIVVLAIEV